MTPAPTPGASRPGSDPSSPILKAVNRGSVSFASLPPSKQLELETADEKLNVDAGAPHAYNYSNAEEVVPLSAAPLTFGYGELLKDGAGEADDNALADALHAGLGSRQVEFTRGPTGKTLKGKYIVRVGWDDVRGWLGEGGTLIGSSRCPSCKSPCSNWEYLLMIYSPNERRQTSSRSQSHQLRNRLFGGVWWRWKFDGCG
jgi:6-phosphofructokinase 1